MNKNAFTQGFLNRLAELGKLADVATSPAKAQGRGPVFASNGLTSGAGSSSRYMDSPAEQDSVEGGGGSEEAAQRLRDARRFEEAAYSGEIKPDRNAPSQLDDPQGDGTDNQARQGMATQDYQHQQGGGSTANRLLSEKVGSKLAESIVDAYEKIQSGKIPPQARARTGQYATGYNHSVRSESDPKKDLEKESAVASDNRVTLEDAPHLKGNENDVISEGTAEDAIKQLYGEGLGAYFARTKKASEDDFDAMVKEALVGAILGGLGRAAGALTRGAGHVGRAATMGRRGGGLVQQGQRMSRAGRSMQRQDRMSTLRKRIGARNPSAVANRNQPVALRGTGGTMPAKTPGFGDKLRGFGDKMRGHMKTFWKGPGGDAMKWQLGSMAANKAMNVFQGGGSQLSTPSGYQGGYGGGYSG